MGYLEELKKSRPQRGLRCGIGGSPINAVLVFGALAFDGIEHDIDFTKHYIQDKFNEKRVKKNEQKMTKEEIQLNISDLKRQIQQEKDEPESYYKTQLKNLSTTLQLSDEKKENLHFKYGLDYIKKGNLQLGKFHIDEVLKLAPKNYFAHHVHSALLQQLGMYEDAMEASKKSILYYDEVISLEKSESWSERFSKFYSLTTEQKKQRLKEKLTFKKKEYPKIMKREDLIKYHINSLFQMGFLKEGLDFLEENKNLLEDNQSLYHFQKGMYFYNLNEVEKAISQFEEFGKFGNNEKILEMLYMCYKRVGDEKRLEQFLQVNNNIEIKFPECHLFLLPSEVFEIIIEFMDNKSLINFSSTSSGHRNEITIMKTNRVFPLSESIYNMDSKQVMDNSYIDFVHQLRDGLWNFPFVNDIISLKVQESNILYLVYKKFDSVRPIEEIYLIPDEMKKEELLLSETKRKSVWLLHKYELMMYLLDDQVIDDIQW